MPLFDVRIIRQPEANSRSSRGDRIPVEAKSAGTNGRQDKGQPRAHWFLEIAPQHKRGVRSARIAASYPEIMDRPKADRSSSSRSQRSDSDNGD